MASVNQQHFKAGGGNAAVKKLLAAQAGAARQLTGASQSSQQTAKPTEAQLARLRARVAARGKAELDRQSKESDRKEASETTYSGNKVYRNGKHIGNMVNGKLVKLGEGPKRDPKIKKQQYPVTIGTVEDKKKILQKLLRLLRLGLLLLVLLLLVPLVVLHLALLAPLLLLGVVLPPEDIR